jgi:outer membrane protein assembly factor BamB
VKRVAVWLAALLLLASSPATHLAEGPVARREAVAVEASAAATRRIASVLDLIEQQNWEAVSAALDELETRLAGELAEVESRRLVEASLCSRIVRAQLPAEALRIHRDRVDDQAMQRYAEGLAARDVSALRLVVERYPASTVAGNAAAALAERCWEQGQLAEAAQIWSLLDDSDSAVIDPAAPLRIRTDVLSPGDIAARLVLTSYYGGDLLRAREQLRDLESQHASASGVLAGERVLWSERLRTLLNARPADAISRRTETASRNNVTPIDLAVGFPAWRTRLSPLDYGEQLTAATMLDGLHASIRPAVSRDRVFLQEPWRLRALRLTDGSPVWPSGATEDDGTIYSVEAPAPLERPWVGDPLLAPAVAGGKLFALMGHPFAVTARLEPRVVQQRLICLDVEAQEGKLLWSRSPRQLLPDAGWRFSAPPLAIDDRVYITARTAAPEPAVGVACIYAESGDLAWFTVACALLSESPAGHHVVAGDALSAGMERLFLTGDFGATACLDSGAGEVQWIALDEPLPWKQPGSTPETEASGRSAVYDRGRVYCVQHDDRTLQALDARTGATLWRTSVPTTIRQIVGIRAGILAASGDQLWGIDIDTGEVRWRFGFDDPSGAASGLAFIAGRSIHWPTRGDLFEVDILSGLAVRRFPLLEAYGIEAGDLLEAGDRLLIASPRSLTAMKAERKGDPVTGIVLDAPVSSSDR